jgi:hypothetical protein
MKAGDKSTWGRKLACAFGVLTIVLAFCMVWNRTVQCGMIHFPAVWAADAIPPALSEIYFGHHVRYTSLEGVSSFYEQQLQGKARDSEHINPIIEELVRRAKSGRPIDRRYRLLGGDDKGIVDFVKFSFRVFGPRVEGLTYTYFLFLAASLFLYVAAYSRSPACLILVTALLASECLIIPAIAYHQQLGSLLALRAFPLLSLVATLHCVLYCSSTGGFALRKLALCTPQLALVVFVIHVRSTAMWQLMTIFVLAALKLMIHSAPWVVRSVRARRVRLPLRAGFLQGLRPACALCVLVLVGWLGLSVYRSVAYPREYREGEQILTRVFWHNLYSGLAFSPRLARRYHLRVDDVSIIRATGRYLLESHRELTWRCIGGESPGYAKIRWTEYDQVVGQMYRSHMLRYPADFLLAHAYYKPVSIARHLLWLWGVRRLPPDLELFCSPDIGDVVKEQVRALSDRLARDPWRGLRNPLAWLLVLVSGLVLGGGDKAEVRRVFAAAAVVTCGAFMPPIIGYPSAHTVAEAFVALTALLFFTVSLAPSLLGCLCRSLSDRSCHAALRS